MAPRSRGLQEEVIKVDCLVNPNAAEMQLVEAAARIMRSWTPIIGAIGTTSRMILTGAGVLTAIWGFSKFVVAVLEPFRERRKRERSPGSVDQQDKAANSV